MVATISYHVLFLITCSTLLAVGHQRYPPTNHYEFATLDGTQKWCKLWFVENQNGCIRYTKLLQTLKTQGKNK